jgi:hypothetical protein
MGVEIPMSLHDNGDPRMLQIRDAQLQHICVRQTYLSVILCMQVDVTLHAACCDKSADPFGLTYFKYRLYSEQYSGSARANPAPVN